MLLEILGAIAIGAIGYNALKDEESRTKSKDFTVKTIDAMNKIMERKYNSGEISDEDFDKFQNAYNKFHSRLGE